jgi:hypothetical protein
MQARLTPIRPILVILTKIFQHPKCGTRVWFYTYFCLKLYSVDKANLCRACLWTCLCLLYSSHFRLLRRSKESQSVKETFFTLISKLLLTSLLDKCCKSCRSVTGNLICSERQSGHFTEIYISALLQLGCAVHISSFAVKAMCSHLGKTYIPNVVKSNSFSFKA